MHFLLLSDFFLHFLCIASISPLLFTLPFLRRFQLSLIDISLMPPYFLSVSPFAASWSFRFRFVFSLRFSSSYISLRAFDFRISFSLRFAISIDFIFIFFIFISFLLRITTFSFLHFYISLSFITDIFISLPLHWFSLPFSLRHWLYSYFISIIFPLAGTLLLSLIEIASFGLLSGYSPLISHLPIFIFIFILPLIFIYAIDSPLRRLVRAFISMLRLPLFFIDSLSHYY